MEVTDLWSAAWGIATLDIPAAVSHLRRLARGDTLYLGDRGGEEINYAQNVAQDALISRGALPCEPVSNLTEAQADALIQRLSPSKSGFDSLRKIHYQTSKVPPNAPDRSRALSWVWPPPSGARGASAPGPGAFTGQSIRITVARY